MIALGYLTSLGYGVLCLILSMIAYKCGLPKKYTRKIVHILIGFEWVILYYFMGSGIHFVAVCLIFTALLFISYKKSLMPMISSDGDNAPGTVYYGVSMTVMAITSLFLKNFIFAFGIAVFCTSIGDGFAGVIGSAVERFNPKVYKNKSLIGTVSAFLFSFASAYVFSLLAGFELGIVNSLIIGAFAAGLELVTEHGLDNISLPLGTSLLSYLLLYVSGIENYTIPFVLTPFIIVLVNCKQLLTKTGIIAAILLDIAVSFALGNFGFVLLLAFLMFSVVIDKIKKHYGKEDRSIAKKGEKRDHVQVMANGLIPAFIALLYLITRNYAFVIAYSVSLAECFADTAASGIGSLSATAFDPFKMKKVPKGLSGGMSPLGTAASLIAPILFLLISVAFGMLTIKWWLIASVCAFSGALFDSLIGSILQAKYRCSVCSCITEREEHCNKKTEKIAGVGIITNDVVNVISVAFASLISIILYFVI